MWYPHSLFLGFFGWQGPVGSWHLSRSCWGARMLRDSMKSWSDSQSDLYSSDQEEEEQMIFGENEDDLEEMMDLSDLPTSLFACSVHEAVFEVQEEKVRGKECEVFSVWMQLLNIFVWIFSVLMHIEGKTQPRVFS